MALQSMRAKVPTANRGIVKQAPKGIPKKYLVNAGVAGVAMLIVGVGLHSALVKDEVPQCSERFGNGTLFGLQQKSGAAIQVVELQSRLAGRDWGLLENARIVDVAGGPSPVALQVRLPVVKTKPDDENPAKSGMGFTWSPAKLSGARSACLTYSVWLPETFDFGTGGGLPGLFGGTTTDAPGLPAKSSFAARYRWRDAGQIEVRAITSDAPQGNSLIIDPDWLKLPRGKWMRLEQEVALNTPGEANGTLRVWIDGKLKFENKRMNYRSDPNAGLRGVVADVHYSLQNLTVAPAPKPTMLQLTPFELRWE